MNYELNIRELALAVTAWLQGKGEKFPERADIELMFVQAVKKEDSKVVLKVTKAKE